MSLSLFFARILVIGGACIIISALFPIQKLIVRLPAGKVRSSWNILMALTLFFVIGYTAYGFAFLANNQDTVDLIVPIIFFSGSIFVLLSSLLSLQTAIDIRKVTMLEQENVTDPLTSIFNRRYMDRRLYEEFARAERYQQPLSIVLIDLDNFKEVNDAFGNPAGDNALVSYTRMMMSTIRAGDIIARYGGDEFLVIATNTAITGAFQLAERIRKKSESQALEIVDEVKKKNHRVRVTVSIGVACNTDKFDSVQAFLACAEQMMKQAKSDGRNRTVIWDVNASAKVEKKPKDINLTL
jgi:diguanylate cyclase (GGDEF)-like protein